MATLFERIAGSYDPAEGDLKIPVHMFMALLYEWKEGRISGAQAKALIGLDDTQTTQALDLVAILNAYPGSTRKMLRIIKDHFYLAEWRTTMDTFRDEAAFWSKLDAEIVAQGGTPPVRS